MLPPFACANDVGLVAVFVFERKFLVDIVVDSHACHNSLLALPVLRWLAAADTTFLHCEPGIERLSQLLALWPAIDSELLILLFCQTDIRLDVALVSSKRRSRYLVAKVERIGDSSQHLP